MNIYLLPRVKTSLMWCEVLPSVVNLWMRTSVFFFFFSLRGFKHFELWVHFWLDSFRKFGMCTEYLKIQESFKAEPMFWKRSSSNQFFGMCNEWGIWGNKIDLNDGEHLRSARRHRQLIASSSSSEMSWHPSIDI